MTKATTNSEQTLGVQQEEYWVFGYGSLMWRPDFPFLEKSVGMLRGYHRSFCVYSYYHRGTPDRPGLVLGLDEGGQCQGIAYKVAADDWNHVYVYLQEREQVTKVYLDVVVDIQLDGGCVDRTGAPVVQALTFIVDKAHEQYAGRLSLDAQVQHIVHGVGRSGRNPDYLADMVSHLADMGWSDDALTTLWEKVSARLGDDCF